jgi:DNA-binding NtrC family response regulator
VGALNARKVDVRVIAATNRDLRTAVAAKRFREDLYCRLAMVEIQAPGLADRKEDLPLLQLHFIARFAAQYGKQVRGLTHRAQIQLSRHSWPGNVRELENVIGHGVMMTASDTVGVQDLPPYMHPSPERPKHMAAAASSGGTLAEVEREYILRVLRETDGVVTSAAGRLGMPRTTLNALMRKLKISRQDL